MKKNIWHDVPGHKDIKVGQYVVPNFISNTIAVKASDHDYVVISPGKSLIEKWPLEWDLCQATMHLVMPNSYHFMGIKAWRLAFPDHKLYASKGAIRRLLKKGVANHGERIYALEEHQPPLPFNYSFLFPPGHRANDVWLKKHDRHSQSSLWVTCDSFLNYDRVSNQPIAKTMQKLLGAAPGLKMSEVVKWLIIDNRPSFKQWALQQIETDNPVTLIPSHGEIAQGDDLSEKLKALISNRL